MIKKVKTSKCPSKFCGSETSFTSRKSFLKRYRKCFEKWSRSQLCFSSTVLKKLRLKSFMPNFSQADVRRKGYSRTYTVFCFAPSRKNEISKLTLTACRSGLRHLLLFLKLDLCSFTKFSPSCIRFRVSEQVSSFKGKLFCGKGPTKNLLLSPVFFNLEFEFFYWRDWEKARTLRQLQKAPSCGNWLQSAKAGSEATQQTQSEATLKSLLPDFPLFTFNCVPIWRLPYPPWYEDQVSDKRKH